MGGCTHVLVDEDNGNVLALLGESVKGTFDRGVLRLGIDDEEVLLRVWRRGDVLGWRVLATRAQTSEERRGQVSYAYSCEEEARAGVLRGVIRACSIVKGLLWWSRSVESFGAANERGPAYLISYDCEELPIFILRDRGGHVQSARRQRTRSQSKLQLSAKWPADG